MLGKDLNLENLKFHIKISALFTTSIFHFTLSPHNRLINSITHLKDFPWVYLHNFSTHMNYTLH